MSSKASYTFTICSKAVLLYDWRNRGKKGGTEMKEGWKWRQAGEGRQAARKKGLHGGRTFVTKEPWRKNFRTEGRILGRKSFITEGKTLGRIEGLLEEGINGGRALRGLGERKDREDETSSFAYIRTNSSYSRYLKGKQKIRQDGRKDEKKGPGILWTEKEQRKEARRKQEHRKEARRKK